MASSQSPSITVEDELLGWQSGVITASALLAAARQRRRGPSAILHSRVASNLTPEFLAQALDFFGAGTVSPDDWQVLLRAQLQDDFEVVLQRFSNQLYWRGIRKPPAAFINEVIDEAFNGSTDILGTLNRRPELLTEAHMEDVTESLLRSATDKLEARSVARDPNLTGRRRWVTTTGIDSRTLKDGTQKKHKPSRHAGLNGVEIDVSKGETFNVGGHQWVHPRQNPKEVKAASNCKCFIQYQKSDGTWTRGGVEDD